jgi:hypothetical protein
MNARRSAMVIAAALLAVGCAAETSAPMPHTDRGALFDELWQEFDLHYSFFQLKGVSWDSVRAVYRPTAVTTTSDAAFAATLSAMLASLRDVHVSLTAAPAIGTSRYVAPCERVPTYYSAALVNRGYVPNLASTSGGHLRYGMASGTVGYVAIASFDGTGWASEMDAAIHAMPAATSLIVDIRDNPGGNDELAASVAGRFADRTRTYGYVRLRDGPAHGDFTDFIVESVSPQGTRFRGPVYLLTNRHNFSSAEDFDLAMRVLPTVTVVGDTTAGASGGPIVRELANGWTYQLSEWIEYTPEKKIFEGTGLAPQIAVAQTASDFARGADAQVERALALAAGR